MNMLRFFCRVKRLLQWVPIIWETYDWDHGSCLKIYQYSLKRLQKCIANGYHLYRERDARRIGVMIHLIDRLTNNDGVYSDPLYDLLDKKYGESVRVSNKVPDTDDKLGGPYYTWDETNPKRETKEFIKEFLAIGKRAGVLEKEDYKLLAKYLERYSKGFWD